MALTEKLTAIGNAIRKKNSTTDLILLADMPQAILNISSGGIEPLDNTVKFMVDGKPYEVVSVKDGNSVNAPSGIPTSENGDFAGWKIDGADAKFPCIPSKDTDIVALFTNNIGRIYEKLNIDREAYPYLVIHCNGVYNYIYFCANYQNANPLTVEQPYYYVAYHTGKKYQGDFDVLVEELRNTTIDAPILKTTNAIIYNDSTHEYYGNFDFLMRGTVYRV